MPNPVFQPVTKIENLRMPSIIEDDNVPVFHAVDHLELLYNNTTKQYASIPSKNTGLAHTVKLSLSVLTVLLILHECFNVGRGAKTTFLWLIWNVGYRYIARFLPF